MARITSLNTLRCLIGFALIGGLASPAAPALSAPEVSVHNVTVTITSDEYNTSGSGAGCSVREAVKAQNDHANFGGCTRVPVAGTTDAILLPSGTYNLTISGASEDADVTGDLDITASVVISATGASVPTIRGGGGWSDRILQFHSGTSQMKRVNVGFGDVGNNASGGGVRIEPGATLTRNNRTVGNNTADGSGGGILNRGTLTLNSSTVSDNEADSAAGGGGGIYNSPNATLTLNDTTVNDNTTSHSGAFPSGGGIYADEDSTLTLHNSTITHNTAGGYGGGILADTGHVSLYRSLVKLNHAGLSDGGLVISGPAPLGTQVTIRESIIRNNTADWNSGGLTIGGSEEINALIVDSTISGNAANDEDDGNGGGLTVVGSQAIVSVVNTTISGNQAAGRGGGVWAFAGVTLNLYNVTIASNISDSDNDGQGTAGGLYVDTGGTDPTVNLYNSLLASNVSNADAAEDCNGTVQGAYFFITNTTGCAASGVGGIANLSALINALGDNGGPVAGAGAGETLKTHSLQTGSLARDNGNPAGCLDQDDTTLVFDQRGPIFYRSLDGDVVPGARCDIGAFEAGQPELVFVPLVLR
jgi:hypothetical protein